MFFFGSGVLQGFRTDVANSTPVNFGLVQEVQFDLSLTSKELYGQNQFPVAVARGTAKLTGKAKVAAISGLALNSFFFGQSIAAGQTATSFGEGPTAIPATPFQITPANAATFVSDYGVTNAATGLPLTKVASGPIAGQYSVNASTGVYLFSTADNVSGVRVLISYTYGITSTGQQITINNPLLGVTPTFQANFYGSYLNKPLTFTVFQAVSSKLAFASKLEDFMIPEMDFSIFANAAGNVAQWSFAEAS